MAKESLTEVFVWLSKNEGRTVRDAMGSLGLGAVSEAELKSFIDDLIEHNKDLVKERGEASFSALMGVAMKSMRGKVDAALVSRVLKERLRDVSK